LQKLLADPPRRHYDFWQMPECVECKHTPACSASTTNAAGSPVCAHHADKFACPVEIRMRAQIRSPNHNPRRFAMAHLLQGERIPRNEVEVTNGKDDGAHSARDAAPPAKTNGQDPTPARNDKYDGSARAREMRAIRAAAAASKPNGHDVTDREESSTMSSTTSTPTPSAPAPAARLCQHPRCTRELSPANRSGYCVAHRDLHRSHRKISSNGHNGGLARDARAPAAKSNGSGKTNGHVEEIAQRVRIMLSAIELPVDEVFAALPKSDKARLLELWLTGAA
jgi:hypothetical protein